MARTLFILFASTALCALTLTGRACAEEPRFPVAVIERFGHLPRELVKAKKSDSEIADAMYLAALARLPTDQEKAVIAKHLAEKSDRVAAVRNIAWALINRKEFMKLHGLDKDLKATLEFYNKDVNELWGKATPEDAGKPKK